MPQWIASSADSSLIPALQSASALETVVHVPDSDTIIIVPTLVQRPVVLREWLRHFPQRPVPVVMTMAQFIRDLGQQVLPSGPRILHESAVEILLRHAARNTTAAVSLGLSAEKIVRWTQQNVTLKTVWDLVATHGEQTRKGRLLAELAEVWTTLFGLYGSRGCDRGTYARLLATTIEARSEVVFERPGSSPVRRLLVVDTHGVTPIDGDVLGALRSRGWDIGVRFCDEPTIPSDLPSSATPKDVAWFASKGWHDGGISRIPEPRMVTLSERPSRIDEVRTALALVRKDVEDGYPLEQIVICLPGSSAYRRLFIQEAQVMGVPLAMPLQRKLSSTRIAAAVRAVCMVLIGNWQRIDVERLFRDPLLERYRSMAGTSVVDIARRDKIRGGEGVHRWIEEFAWGEKVTREALERRKNSGTDDAWTRDRSLNEYVRARDVLQSLAHLLPHDASRPLSGERFVDVIRNAILEGMGLEESLELSLRTVEQNADDVALLERVACDRLRESLIFYGGIVKDHELDDVSFAEHFSAWWGLVEKSMVDDNRLLRGLRIAGPAELRSSNADHVIVVGLVEGEFPRTMANIFDDELIPDVLLRMNVESMCDCLAAAHGRRLTMLWPKRIDDALTIPSSLVAMIPEVPISNLVITSEQPSTATGRSLSAPYRVDPRVTIGPGVPRVAMPDFEQDRGRRMSASRLDVMTSCPYKYVAAKILRLDDASTDDARLTSLERGTILHELIVLFFDRIKPRSPFSNLTAQALLERRVELVRSDMPLYWGILCKLVDEYAERHGWTHTFAQVERQALVGSDRLPGLLRRWLELEVLYQEETGHAPALLEHTINADLTLNDGPRERNMKITARIDRIDIAKSSDGVSFIVGDYKPSVSSGYTMQAVFDGSLSQMPMYIKSTALWLEQCGIPNTPLGATYRSFGKSLHETSDPRIQMVLRDPRIASWKDYRSISMSQSPSDYAHLVQLPLQEQVDAILLRAMDLNDAILAGEFPVMPQKGACMFCRMKELCRKEQWGVVEEHSKESPV